MNTPMKPVLLLLLCILTAISYAQQKPDTRPKLFAALSETIKVNDTALQNAFTLFEGQNASIVLANNLTFSGVVISNEVKYNNLQSVIIKSVLLNNTLLSLSKIKNGWKRIDSN